MDVTVSYTEQWDWMESELIDEDVKNEVKGKDGLFLGDIINLQLIKTMKELVNELKKPKKPAEGFSVTM
jgi:hypothetical protein